TLDDVLLALEPLGHAARGGQRDRLGLRHLAASSGWKQRQPWLPETVSGGSIRQASVAWAQRGRKGQPCGRPSGGGAWPGSWCSGWPRTVASGVGSISPRV